MRENGSALVLSLISMLVFVILGTVVYRLTHTLTYESLFQKRLTQSQSIAEAGLEDALYQLRLNPSTRTAFTKNFAAGSYTVTFSTATPPWVSSVGRSARIALFGPTHTALRAQAQIVYASSSSACTTYSGAAATINGYMDAYDSSVSTQPSTFGFGGRFCSNDSFKTKNHGGVSVNADVKYFKNPAPKASTIGGTITKTTFTWTLPLYDGTSYANNNNNASISPLYYNSVTKSLIIPLGVTVTLSSGTYYFGVMTINGHLKANTGSGMVEIYMTSNLTLPAKILGNGMISNTSGIPSRLALYPQGGITVNLQSSSPLMAVVYGRSANITLSQNLHGNIIGNKVTVSDPYTFHFDKALLLSFPSRVTWTPGSWSASPR